MDETETKEGCGGTVILYIRLSFLESSENSELMTTFCQTDTKLLKLLLNFNIFFMRRFDQCNLATKVQSYATFENLTTLILAFQRWGNF